MIIVPHLVKYWAWNLEDRLDQEILSDMFLVAQDPVHLKYNTFCLQQQYKLKVAKKYCFGYMKRLVVLPW